MLLALDGEESGLRGARAFVADPPAPLSALAINLNMDMIGRDPNDILYVVGTRQQPFLKPFIERVAAKAPVKLVMGHDDPPSPTPTGAVPVAPLWQGGGGAPVPEAGFLGFDAGRPEGARPPARPRG